MKIMRPFYLTIVTIFLFHSCSQKPINNKAIIPESSVFVIDSIKVNDSIKISKTLHLEMNNKVLLFPSIQNKSVLDSIYNIVGIKLENYSKEKIVKELTKQKDTYFSQEKENSKEYMPEFEQTWEDNFYMNVFSNHNDILTLSYESNGFSGGAHGYYSILFKNFDLKNNKTIQLSDIFNEVQKINWDKILMENFKNKDQKEMLLVDKIPVNNNFYFNDKEITFVYNQYEITAYAAGVVEIAIPFSELKSYLKPDFIKQNNIK